MLGRHLESTATEEQGTQGTDLNGICGYNVILDTHRVETTPGQRCCGGTENSHEQKPGRKSCERRQVHKAIGQFATVNRLSDAHDGLRTSVRNVTKL